ncbi:MAG: hypothetical protein GY805_02635 [Chloroflexi bacterium]|nr:hypothetical protein [Chloroflexota bacterium]
MTNKSRNDLLLFSFEMMPSIRIIAWEFIQNLPLITGLILALQLWRQDKWGTAVVCVVISSVIGSFMIRLTEVKIVTDHREPLSVTIMNIIVMSLLMLIFIFYLTARWSNWQVDLFVGGLAGVVLGAAQNLAAKKPIGIRHMTAFVFAFPLALIGIRTLVGILPTAITILTITIVVTVIISLIDYSVV